MRTVVGPGLGKNVNLITVVLIDNCGGNNNFLFLQLLIFV